MEYLTGVAPLAEKKRPECACKGLIGPDREQDQLIQQPTGASSTVRLAALFGRLSSAAEKIFRAAAARA
jgi:hypothetical protein